MTTVSATSRGNADVDPRPVVVVVADHVGAERVAMERARLLFGDDHEHVVVHATSADTICGSAAAHEAVGVVVGVTLPAGARARAPWLVQTVRKAPCPVIIVVDDG